MSHGFELNDTAAQSFAPPLVAPGAFGWIEGVMAWLNGFIAILGGLALMAASVVLTHSVVVRYFLKLPTYWQDEASVFLIVGAVFLSAAGVQARRGHVGIEALASLLSERTNRLRLILVDILSSVFCAFFAWKSWTLLLEALHENHHSSSTWAPPLWVPYSLMALGMTLLTIQIGLLILRALIPTGVRS